MRAKPVKKISLWGLYVHGEKGGKQEDTKPGLNQAWELVFETIFEPVIIYVMFMLFMLFMCIIYNNCFKITLNS